MQGPDGRQEVNNNYSRQREVCIVLASTISQEKDKQQITTYRTLSVRAQCTSSTSFKVLEQPEGAILTEDFYILTELSGDGFIRTSFYLSYFTRILWRFVTVTFKLTNKDCAPPDHIWRIERFFIENFVGQLAFLPFVNNNLEHLMKILLVSWLADIMRVS